MEGERRRQESLSFPPLMQQTSQTSSVNTAAVEIHENEKTERQRDSETEKELRFPRLPVRERTRVFR